MRAWPVQAFARPGAFARLAAFGRLGAFPRLAALAVAGLLLAAALAGPAFAHATLIASEPADGAAVAEAPGAFRLTFNETVAATAATLVGGGRSVALGPATSDGRTVVFAAPEGLAPGGYALSYRVVSEDGHPVGGAVTFSIGAAGAGPAVAPAPADRALATAIWATRLALAIGLLFGAGGAFAAAYLHPEGRDGRKTVALLLALGLAAAPAALALQGADLAAGELADALKPEIWRLALATSYVWTVLIAAAALACGLASLGLRGRASSVTAAAALAGAGVAFAASGHASVASPQALMRVAVFVHAAAAAFWLGALGPLGLALRRDAASATGALARFSALAPFVVAALLVAGAVLGVRQLERVEALWTTDYGAALLAKLGLVAGLLALAAANRARWTQGALAGNAGARRALRRSVAAEVALGVAILGVVGLWRFTPPPRALEAARPAVVRLSSGPVTAEAIFRPGRAGETELTVAASSPRGPVEGKGLTIVLSNPKAGVGELSREARPLGGGRWRVDRLALPVAGVWMVRVEILVTDFDVVTFEGEITLRP